jgi:hypothetical protein
LKTIQSLLVCQHGGLRDQNVDLGIDAGVVPRFFELEVGLGGVHCLLLLLNLLG